MKVESPQFTEADVASFVTDYFEKERQLLIDRVEAIIRDAQSLVPQIQFSESSDDSWNAVETLAHMVTTSQYFGWLANRVATKRDAGEIMEMIRLRDVVSGEAAQLPVEELAEQLETNLRRTIAFLEKVPYDDLRTTFDYVGRPLTAEDAIRIPLCAHLESHIEQIRQAISANPA